MKLSGLDPIFCLYFLISQLYSPYQACSSFQNAFTLLGESRFESFGEMMENDVVNVNLLERILKTRRVNESRVVDDLLLAINEEKKHQVLGSLRLGTIKKDSDSVRPIKVTLGSADSVKEILSKAKTLKTLYGSNEMFSKMYLAPDRSQEERIEHRKLVEEMKLLISKEPNKHHCIRNGKIVSVLRG